MADDKFSLGDILWEYADYTPPAATPAKPAAPLPPETPQQPLSAEALFSTCLFIGDSRTVGLMEYGGMNGATRTG